VRERNRRWDEGQITAAWHENLILERFFAPVLDRSTYASKDGNRWPPEHRADAEARGRDGAPFVSTAEPYRILTWSKPVYWLAIGSAVFLCTIAGWRMRSRP
jgi:hypothetical protein